ncbi:hypothetical protein CDD83_4798 [Cordyceps sp. RAO-2017]|nr:hypothetical protein CDD83_4798 [Cordyceps sp. RAO-2017]
MIVCLGAGLTSTDGHVVETTYDSRNLGAAGSQRLIVDGNVQPAALNTTGRFKEAKWARLDGFGGYLFLDGREVIARREERTGSWRDVDDAGAADPVTRRYLTLYRSHGTNPKDSGYAYAVMPGAKTGEVRASVGKVKVLANTPERQAVRIGDVFAANFFAPGSTGGLRVSAPCSVLIRGASIYVADPGHQASKVDVTWQGNTRTVNLAGMAGVTVKL